VRPPVHGHADWLACLLMDSAYARSVHLVLRQKELSNLLHGYVGLHVLAVIPHMYNVLHIIIYVWYADTTD
jgi:hypothetical protein